MLRRFTARTLLAPSRANEASIMRCMLFLYGNLNGELHSERKRRPRARPRPKLFRSHKSAVRRRKTAVRRRKKAVRRRCVVGPHAALDPHPADPANPRHPANELQARTAVLLPRDPALAAQETDMGHLDKIFFQTLLRARPPDACRLRRKR